MIQADQLYEHLLRPTLLRVQNLAGEIQTTLDGDMKTTEGGTHGTITTTTRLQAALGGLGLLLGIAFALLISGLDRSPGGRDDGDRDSDPRPRRPRRRDPGARPQGRGRRDGACRRRLQSGALIEGAELAVAQKAEQDRKEQRQLQVTEAIAAYESSVGRSLGALGAAASEMRRTAEEMLATAEDAGRETGAVSGAADQALANVPRRRYGNRRH